MRVLRVSVRQGGRQERNENPTRKTTTGRKGTTARVNRKGGICCGGNIPRNYIWEVRSKASTPEMTKKPFKAFLHRKAADFRRYSKTALACIEASSIFDLDKSARFNLWINRCVILHFFSSGGVRNPNADYIPFPCVFCVIGMRIKSLFCAYFV